MNKLSNVEIEKIQKLRIMGLSYDEIVKDAKHSIHTIIRYCAGIKKGRKYNE